MRLAPYGTAHGFPALVFDSQHRLDLPLIVFVRQAQRRLSPRSVRGLFVRITPVSDFHFAAAEPNEQSSWNTSAERVRAFAAQYLEEELGCVVNRHRLGFELVSLTARSPSNVGIFLASVRLFFNVMRHRLLRGDNPLIDVGSRLALDVDDRIEDGPPVVPDIVASRCPARVGD